jgi:DNA-binding transcriptional regulator YhcF (GntR family)
METILPCSRRRVPHGLPELSVLECRNRTAIDKVDTITGLLRDVAMKTQNDRLQGFYSIRSVAEHFRVPPARVMRIYHRLGEEGLLRMVWGSRTLLEPLKSSRNGECRCVGIAVDLHRFATSADYRESVVALQVEMWNHEVDEHFLFFKEQEDEIIGLCKRNHHPHIDTVLWFLPSACCRPTLLRLHDLGLRVFSLSDKPIRGMPHCYVIADRSSMRRVIRRQVLKI